MNNLLSANFRRLKNSRMFWDCCAVTLLGAAATMLLDCRTAARVLAENPEYVYRLDDYFLSPVPVTGILMALFAASFLGTEYGDGTMRNKLIVGHTRSAIYLSALLPGICAALAIAAASLLGRLAGIPTLGGWQGGAGALCGHIAVYAGIAAALTACFTLIGMLSSHRSATMALCLFTFLGLLMLASYLYNALCEPEMVSEMMVTVNGVQASDPHPNPSYIGGTLRTVYEIVLLILPTGQAILLANGESGPALPQVAASLGVAALVTAAGIALFRRKDIQ